MLSSQAKEKDLIFSLYSNSRTVFRLKDIALICGETDALSLGQRLNYYVRTGRLLNPRKGIYAKMGYNPEELICTLYVPSYLSLEYVLQKAGVIFQYDSALTAVTYLSRSVEIGGTTYRYRKLKGEILINTEGILQTPSGTINTATPERAFLDLLYLNKNYYFDNLSILDAEKVDKLLPVYQSASLTRRTLKLLGDVRY